MKTSLVNLVIGLDTALERRISEMNDGKYEDAKKKFSDALRLLKEVSVAFHGTEAQKYLDEIVERMLSFRGFYLQK